MPRLRQYADGRGYYLAGHFPDVGFCTWQVGKEGLAFLAKRGVTASGDTLRIGDLRELLDRGLAGTAGSGTSPTPAAPPPQWVKPLADGLVAWSRSGGVEDLGRITCPGFGASGDFRPRCFPAAFLTWLGELDGATGLPLLAGISAAEFETLTVEAGLDLHEDPLFGHLIHRGAIGVLWRLGRLTGSVAVRLRAGAGCPAEWRADALLSWLFARVEEHEGRRRGSPRPAVPRRPAGWIGPRIVWAVGLQEVTALLPGQPLPSGITGVEWRAGRGKAIYPQARPAPRGRLIEESVSEPLPPADVYAVELVPSGGAAARARWTIGCPTGAPFVLFHPDGRLVDAEEPDPLAPGPYLALVRPGQEAAARALGGITFTEQIPVGPIGWPGWQGWAVDVGPGAAIPCYAVADSAELVRWEADPPPDAGVCWLEPCPVFIGELPRIRLQPAAAFRDAVVEIVVAAAGGQAAEPIYLTLGRDVPVEAAGTVGVADLNAVPRLNSRFGRYQLRCQPAGRIDRLPLALGFSRLPGMALEYVPDPQCPSAATAVRFVANDPLVEVTNGPDTEILPEQAGAGPGRFVARSTSPDSAPRVHIRSREAGWEVRVRVGVSRAGLVSNESGFQGWQPLPIENLDLARIGLGDRLRVEFHVPPVTEDGRLVTRLPGRGESLVGEPLGRSAGHRLFELPLHRWRDAFGTSSVGTIQVRGGGGWVDVVRLASAERTHPTRVSPPPAETWWQRLSSELDLAVGGGDTATASALITRCLTSMSTSGCSVCSADLLPLSAARAALAVLPPSEWQPTRSALDRLRDRADLPEARILATVLDLRGAERSASAGEWSLARVEEVEARLPNDPGAAVVRAECWSRLARSANGPAPGCWRACADWAVRYLAAGLPETGIAFSDALLLRDLAWMALGSPPSTDPVPIGVQPVHRGWIDAVRFAAGFVRQPWHGRAKPELRLGLTAAAPSVLCPEDAALIRVAVGIAIGLGEPERHWPLVRGLPDGYFYALPLLRARYARYADDGTADEEYARAWAAFVSGGDAAMLDVIAAERP